MTRPPQSESRPRQAVQSYLDALLQEATEAQPAQDEAAVAASASPVAAAGSAADSAHPGVAQASLADSSGSMAVLAADSARPGVAQASLADNPGSTAVQTRADEFEAAMRDEQARDAARLPPPVAAASPGTGALERPDPVAPGTPSAGRAFAPPQAAQLQASRPAAAQSPLTRWAEPAPPLSAPLLLPSAPLFNLVETELRLDVDPPSPASAAVTVSSAPPRSSAPEAESQVCVAREAAELPASTLLDSAPAAATQAPPASGASPAASATATLTDAPGYPAQASDRVAEAASPLRAGGPPAWGADGRPAWASEPFECLLFDVAGLTLAVPLVCLGSIYSLAGQELTPLFGQPDWFLGILPSLSGNLKVLDTARWVMPDRYREDFQQGLQYVISVQGYEWGLAVHQVSRSLRLDPNEIKWRTQRSQRPWLAGTVIEHMCALLDVAALAELIASGGAREMELAARQAAKAALKPAARATR